MITHPRLLRIVAILEGISFLVLLLVAMPLKYLAEMPAAVRYTGWLHGVLFMAFLFLILIHLNAGLIRFRTAVLAALAAVLPAGPFFLRFERPPEKAD